MLLRCFLIFLLFFPLSIYAAVYEIIEPDFVETARAYAHTEEFKQKVLQERDKKVDEIKSMMGEKLAKSESDFSYEVEYFYTLPQDMPRVDRDGNIIGILYPKGYTFEPLKYIVNIPPHIIIYNPCNENERDFVKQLRSKLDKSYQKYMLVTSGCSLEDISKINTNYPTYLLDKDSVEKFNLKYTVSVVSVDNIKGVFNVKVYSTDKKIQQ